MQNDEAVLLSSDSNYGENNEEEYTLNERHSKQAAGKKSRQSNQSRGQKANNTVVAEDEIENTGCEDTVFIDNLPKDDWALKLMIKDVNWHIRDLEKKFFEEEDSEVEEDLKQNQYISAAEHN